MTGMSGTGKSTALAELGRRGFRVVDTDLPGWSEWIEDEADPEGGGWFWREDRIAELLATEDERTLYVSGTVSNQGKFYDRFDAIVLLSAPAEVILDRVAHRRTSTAKARWNATSSFPTSTGWNPDCGRRPPTRSMRRDRSTRSSAS